MTTAATPAPRPAPGPAPRSRVLGAPGATRAGRGRRESAGGARPAPHPGGVGAAARSGPGPVDGPGSGSIGGPVLVGRATELQVAHEAVLRGSGRIVWTGPPGAGRTSILECAASLAEAAGAHVLRWPALAGSPDAVREALGVARPATGPRRRVEDRHPSGAPAGAVVLVVDDLDRVPADVRADLLEVLPHASRPVVLLATAAFPAEDCRELDVRPLAPLSAPEALTMVREGGGPVVAPHVLADVLRETDGVPGAVLETLALLSEDQRRGWVSVPDPAPVAGAVRRHAHAVLGGLDGRDRRILLTAGVAVTRRTDVLLRALGTDVTGLLESRAAEHIDLVAGHFAVHDRRVRAVVHDEASVRERTSVHRSLAEAAAELGEPAAAVWHRALAALEGDPGLVAPLEGAASALLERGEAGWAVRVAREALAHAVPADRPAALALLGRAALRANLLVDARDALQEAFQEPGAVGDGAVADLLITLTRLSGHVPAEALAPSGAPALLAAAVLHAGHGRPARARAALSSLTAGVATPAPTDPNGALLADARALVAATVSLAEGDPGPATEVRAHVERAPGLAELGTALGALALSLDGRPEEARARLATTAADRRAARGRDPWSGLATAPSAVRRGWSGDQAFVRSCTSLSEVLVELHAGDLARARALLWEAVLDAPCDQGADGLAAVLAGRLAVMCDGRTDALADTLAGLLAQPAPPRIRTELVRTRAFGSFLRGESRRAASILGLVEGQDDDAFWVCLPTFSRAELVVLGGRRPPGARRVGTAAAEARWAVRCPGPIGALRRARADLAERATSDDAPHLVAGVLVALRDVDNAFEVAQAHLLAGQVLRGLGRSAEGTAHVVSAVELFETSGARAVADVAREVLRRPDPVDGERSGAARVRRPTADARPAPVRVRSTATAARAAEVPPAGVGPSWAAHLTPREVEVARAVAAGISNRAVAARLSLSVRTVEVHLTSIFRKLGTSSRTELALLVARHDA